LIALIALLIIVLIASGVSTYFLFFPYGNNTVNARAAIPIVGHAFFISSGLLSPSPESSQGITDQLQINLQKISPPQSGKSYYAWLLNKKGSEPKPIPLGKVMFNPDGTASLTYGGDPEHTDLLASNAHPHRHGSMDSRAHSHTDSASAGRSGRQGTACGVALQSGESQRPIVFA